jgi:hypothetical protein
VKRQLQDAWENVFLPELAPADRLQHALQQVLEQPETPALLQHPALKPLLEAVTEIGQLSSERR